MQEKIDTNVSSAFSASIFKAVEDSGLSKRAFAEKAGITHGALNNYLSGRLPKIEEAIKIANFLGVTIDELIYGRHSQPTGDAAVWKHRALKAEERIGDLKTAVNAALKKF